MDLQLAPGQNRLSPELGEFLWIPEPPFLGSASRDLALLAAAFQGRAQGARLDRQRVPTGSVVTGHQTSDHLARLLVRQEILETRVGSPQRAITLAHRYQLVTPVSGAVVLENQAQYEANDLRPAAEDSVPVIPEPGTWLMLLLAVTGLTWFQRRPCQLPEA
jgi:hypothetical protein